MTQEPDIDELGRRIRDGYSAPPPAEGFVQALGEELARELQTAAGGVGAGAAADGRPAHSAGLWRRTWPGLAAAGVAAAFFAAGFTTVLNRPQPAGPTLAQGSAGRVVASAPAGDANTNGRENRQLQPAGSGTGTANASSDFNGMDRRLADLRAQVGNANRLTPHETDQVVLGGVNGFGSPVAPTSLPTSRPAPADGLRISNPLGEALAALWPADGDAKDSLGVNPGQLAGGAAFAEGRSGQAFKLDGRDGRVTMGDTLNWGADSWAAALWYKRAAASGKPTALLIKGRTTYGTPQNAGYQLFLTENGTVMFSVADAAGAEVAVEAKEPAINEWHHVAGVLDRPAGELCLYIDGKLAAKKAVAGLGNLDTNIPLALGCLDRGEHGPLEAPFEGLIDDAAMWKRALSAGEIDAICQAASLQDVLWISVAGPPRVARTPEADRVTLADGSVLLGVIGNDGYALDTSLGKREIPQARVSAIVPRAGKDGAVSVMLTDGQVLVGKLAQEAIELKLSTGSTLRIPLADLRECAYAISAAKPEVRTAAGPMLVHADGHWLALDGDLPALTLATVMGPCVLPLADTLEIVAADTLNTRHTARLANGSTLTGALSPETVTFKLRLGGELACKPTDIRQIVLGGKPLTEAADALVRTRGGDVLAGTLKDAEVTVRTKFGPASVPSASIVSIDFDAKDPSLATLKQWDGVVIQGNLAAAELTVTLGNDGPILKVPLAQIAGVACANPMPPPETLQKIGQLVGHLGAESYKDREEAMAELIRMGAKIVPALRRMPASADAEVRARLEQVFHGLGEGSPAATTQSVPLTGENTVRP
jgi:hypothetical protein